MGRITKKNTLKPRQKTRGFYIQKPDPKTRENHTQNHARKKSAQSTLKVDKNFAPNFSDIIKGVGGTKIIAPYGAHKNHFREMTL